MNTAASIVTPIAAAVLAFAGAVVGQWWARRSAQELDHWRHREDTMRMLRWSVELAAGDHPKRAEAGIEVLTGLTQSELLQPEYKRLVVGIARMFLQPPVDVYTRSDIPPAIVEAEPDGIS